MRNRVNFIEGVYSVCCGSGHLGTKHNFSALPNKSGINPMLSFGKKQNLERMLLDTFSHNLPMSKFHFVWNCTYLQYQPVLVSDQQGQWLCNQQGWIHNLMLSLKIWVPLGNLLSLSEPQFSHLYGRYRFMGNNTLFCGDGVQIK